MTIKPYFFKILRWGEGVFKTAISVELKLWVLLAILGGVFLAGYIIGR